MAGATAEELLGLAVDPGSLAEWEYRGRTVVLRGMTAHEACTAIQMMNDMGLADGLEFDLDEQAIVRMMGMPYSVGGHPIPYMLRRCVHEPALDDAAAEAVADTLALGEALSLMTAVFDLTDMGDDAGSEKEQDRKNAPAAAAG